MQKIDMVLTRSAMSSSNHDKLLYLNYRSCKGLHSHKGTKFNSFSKFVLHINTFIRSFSLKPNVEVYTFYIPAK